MTNPTGEKSPADQLRSALEAATERDIRRDERLRLADLLTEHRDALASYTSRPEKVVELVALLLRLDDNLVVPPRHSWGGSLVDVEADSDDPAWRVGCSGCDWSVEAPMSQAIAAGRAHEALNVVEIR